MINSLIVINASPERFPYIEIRGEDYEILESKPLACNIYPEQAIVNYLKEISEEKEYNYKKLIVTGPTMYIKRIAENVKENFPSVEDFNIGG